MTKLTWRDGSSCLIALTIDATAVQTMKKDLGETMWTPITVYNVSHEIISTQKTYTATLAQ
jgi:hypothetical protein